VAVQSALIRECLPGFTAEHRLTALDDTVQPRIWLGNSITTPTHLDEWHNIGCVVAGRRRFTLFPPGQVANLYIGPIDFAPTGAPMSLVPLHAPDFGRFPRFRQALAAAVTAELQAGDAIYIPPLWWHNVESLEPFNVLANYWWHALPGVATQAESGFDSLVHAIANLRSLPPATRDAWRALFDHYVFSDEAEATSHIPPHRHGLLGRLTPADRDKVRDYLAQRLKR
jgi:cupin-like protein